MYALNAFKNVPLYCHNRHAFNMTFSRILQLLVSMQLLYLQFTQILSKDDVYSVNNI